MNLLLLSAIGLFIYSIYKWVSKNNDFFKKRCIVHIKPTFLLGNTAEFFFQKITLRELTQKLYTSFPAERVIGFFDLLTPKYLIRDPAIAKQIMVKDFDSFEDRVFFINPEVDSLFGKSLFCMRGKKWREMRPTLTPAFSGKKMRIALELVRNCALNTTKHFHDRFKEKNVICIEMIDVFSRYSTDVMATCFFGYDVNSFKDTNNDVYKMISNMTISNLKFIFQGLAPKLMKIFKIECFSNNFRQFISSMVLDNINSRRISGLSRPDLIDLLMKAQKGTLINEDDNRLLPDGFATVTESTIGMRKSNYEWTDAELISQCFIFLFGAHDTVRSILLAASYELSMNQDVQQKLFCEINENEQNSNGKPITYESLQKLKYLDMFISEVMRIRPAATTVDRVCSKDFELQIDGRNVKINKGSCIWIPIFAYHHDHKYFPNPQKFDPERFSDENKENIQQGTYIPFGNGPRACIGSRFALMELKIQLYYFVKDFSLEINSKTELPVIIQSTPLGVHPRNGLHLNIRLRK